MSDRGDDIGAVLFVLFCFVKAGVSGLFRFHCAAVVDLFGNLCSLRGDERPVEDSERHSAHGAGALDL